MVVPWSKASTIDTPANVNKDLADIFGQLFDETCTHHHRVRSLANWWITWAANSVTSLLLAWKKDTMNGTGIHPDTGNTATCGRDNTGTDLDTSTDTDAGTSINDSNDTAPIVPRYN